MGLLDWIKGRGESDQDRRLRHWRAAWRDASRNPGNGGVERLRSELDAMGLSEDDVEIEREMLEGLGRLSELTKLAEDGPLPAVETGHRAVGSDTCHFTAPASMPDEPSQPSGRLLLTSSRAIFLGGTGATAGWHTLGEAMHADRDVLLVRHDKQRLYRFRCNTYGDAMEGAFLAARLIKRRRAAAGRQSPGA